MKRTLILALIFSLIFSTIAFADGLPNLDTTYGVDMPTLASVLGIKPETENVSENETVQKYKAITENEFDTFLKGIDDDGCYLEEYTVDGDVFKGKFTKKNMSFTVMYDISKEETVVSYPIGTNPMTLSVNNTLTENGTVLFGKYEQDNNIMNGAEPIEWIVLDLTDDQVGDIITFGCYEQDNNLDNGKEPIEWLILDEQGDSFLLVSKYGLDATPYNERWEYLTWEECTLRKWLNDDFLTEAFTTEEQQLIVESKIINSNNSKYGTSGGNNTTDKIFLLSIDEAEKYFSTDEARKCAPTDYAVANGAGTSNSYKVDEKATGWWWLRSPGYDTSGAAYIGDNGGVNVGGTHLYYGGYMDRPALWINP